MSDAYRRSWFQRLGQSFVSIGPVSFMAARTFHHADRAVYRLSDGRYTAISLLAGLPIIKLTTTGAKSSLQRSVPLIGIPDGEELILIASNWGQKKHPSWYYNMRANPEVQVTIGGVSRDYVAREVQGEVYEASWDKAVSVYSGYEAYKRRTGGREIPIFVLTPADGVV